MVILLYILFFIAALIVILLVMIQDDQGEGIGGLFGGGSRTPFGSRSGNVLTRFTGIIAGVFLLVCILVGLVNRSAERGTIAAETTEQTTQQKFFEPIVRDATVSPSPSPDASASPSQEK